MRSRITSLESSNRDTVALLESKSSAYDDLANELSQKHQKTIDLRREISTLEQTIQSANSSASTTKFREQNLQQELESVKRNNEWLNQELGTKSKEYVKFRKEKSARIAELQRENEDISTTVDSLRRTEQTLRTRLDEVTQKADEYLTQTHELREEASRLEENFRVELDTANRLGELMKESLKTEKDRNQELSSQLDQSKENAAEEIGRINAEIETEHEDRLTAERRITELEIEKERLEADAALHANAGVVPATPSRRTVGSRVGTPRLEGTPGPGGSRGGINYTQLLDDYHGATKQLHVESKRNEVLSAALDDMLHNLEEQQPQIVEMKAENARLEQNAVEMSNDADHHIAERDQAKKEAKKWERQVTGLAKEGDLLRQQLRDLSSQVKVLLMELNAQNQGLDSFTPDQRARLEELARGDLDGELSQTITDTDRFISQHLATFRDIHELHAQHTKLLRLARELGDKMEGEEAQAEKSQASQNQAELEELRLKYERCREEMGVVVAQSKGFIRERDMFRRMLAHRGQIPAGSDLASMFGDSVNGSQAPLTPARNGLHGGNDLSPSSKDIADYTKLIKEMQSHFDSYRQEMSSDRSVLKEQITGLTKKNSELQDQVSKKGHDANLAHNRLEMLQGNYNMLKNENLELQKRSQSLSEQAARQDIRTQQVAEDLVESRGLAESMRNEVANFKAEKGFWKNVEKRLTEENQGLLSDRDRLNTLNANLQNLLNEREHTDADSRRRLQSQVETLESELQAARRKLTEETEETKRIALRREYDNQQNQSRIEDFVTSLSTTREELVAAKTSRDHLQSRVDELSIELRSAEERLNVLYPQSGTRGGASGATGNTADDTSVTKEQELALELAQIRRDYELVQAELANANVQVEQYRAISQGAEEELRNFNETQDQYRQEMDAIEEERNEKIKSLEQTIENLRSEVTSLNAEFLTVRSENENHNRKLEEQKNTFDTELAKLKDDNERIEAASQYHQEDLKAQAEIAQQAQQSYENELVKHAEAAKNLQKVRAEYNDLKLEVRSLKATADADKVKLAQNEESWSEARERYERELTDIKSRRDDLNSQNRLLHQQLESVNKQISELQRKRATNADDGDETTTVRDSEGNNLQEVIRYLRREKEIVDVQLDLSQQEARRLRQQLEHTQSQLEETRFKLSQQRHVEENSERNALNHKKLLETIEELNLNRESNSALRQEKNQIQASLNEKIRGIEEIQAQLQPLQAKVTELEDMKESQDEELRMTREAKERFEQRYLDVLHKSESIDPAEHEKISTKAKELETERDELLSAKEDLQAQVDGFPDRLKETLDEANERLQQSRNKLIEQSKNKNREQNQKITEKDNALKAAEATILTNSQRLAELEQELQSLNDELEQAKSDRDQAVQAAKQAETTQAQGSEDGQVNEGAAVSSAELQALNQKLETANLQSQAEASRAAQLQNEVTTAQTKISELQSKIVSCFQNTCVEMSLTLFQTSTEQDLSQAQSRISVLEEQQRAQPLQNAQQSDTSESISIEVSSEEVEGLRQSLAKAEEEAEKYKTEVSVYQHAANVQTEGEAPSIIDQIRSQVDEIRAELTARHEARVRQSDETFVKRTNAMKGALNKRLNEAKAELRQSIDTLKAEHATEIETLNTRHQEELEELRKITANPNETAQKSEPEAKVEEAHAAWQPTDEEVRELLQSNETARKLVQNSLTVRMTKVREEQHQILNTRLAEAETKANAAKDQAVQMEGKKSSVKLNMAENRAKNAQAKIDVVQQAANETPQKPVAEVWAIAKTVKAAAAAAAASNTGAPLAAATTAPSSAQTSGPAAPTAGVADSGQPNAFTPNPFAQSFSPIQAGSGPSANVQSQSSQQRTQASQIPSVSNAFASAQRSGNQPIPSLGQSVHAPSLGQQPAAQINGAQVANSSNTTRLPDGALQPQPGRGAGPSAPRTLSGSGLPIPSTGRGGLPVPSRGSNIGRGRGGRGNRGGMANLNTANAQSDSIHQSQNSPGSNARQFVPAKRARDEGGLDASQHAGNEGKRLRGGGQFSG